MGLLAPVAGLLVYRIGPRWLVFAGTFAIGLGLILLSRVHTLPMFYGACILTSMGMGLTIGVVPMTVVAQWFRKRVSTATGIAVSGTALGGLIVPLATMLIDLYGWRTAMLVLGIGMWVLPMPLSLLLRNKPERYGCLPDGEIIDTDIPCQPVDPADEQKIKPRIPLGRILTSTTFWLITLPFTANLLVISAVMTHVMPYLGTIGVSRSIASLFASALPICTILGRLGFGWLGDRYDRRRLTACAFGLTSLAILMFSNIATAGPWLILAFHYHFRHRAWGYCDHDPGPGGRIFLTGDVRHSPRFRYGHHDHRTDTRTSFRRVGFRHLGQLSGRVVCAGRISRCRCGNRPGYSP